jgi:hypothetical protein
MCVGVCVWEGGWLPPSPPLAVSLPLAPRRMLLESHPSWATAYASASGS